jgi:hypothetical protein
MVSKAAPLSAVPQETSQAFRRLHAWARTLNPAWHTITIMFLRGPERVLLRNTRWKVQMRISGWMKERHVEYAVQITMSVYGGPPSRAAVRKRKAVFSQIADRLSNLGYSATWYGDKVGVGLFQRGFPDFAMLRREVRRLQTTPFKSILPGVRQAGYGAAERRRAADTI